MKISEMTNDQASIALVRLSTPFANICDDDEMLTLIDELNALRKKSDIPVLKAIANLLPKFVSFGLAKHKNDLYEIVGALLMESTAAVGKMNFVETLRAVRESYDEVLGSFFTRSVKARTSNGD